MTLEPSVPQPREIHHEVAAGETLADIAAQHGIEDWTLLWKHNFDRIANPDDLPRQGPDGAPFRLRIPKDNDHELGYRLLEEETGAHNLRKYTGGTSWRDPRVWFSVTLRDERGEPVPEGTQVEVRDPDGDLLQLATVQNGRILVRGPRKDLQLRFIISGEFERLCRWFEDVEPGRQNRFPQAELLDRPTPPAAPAPEGLPEQAELRRRLGMLADADDPPPGWLSTRIRPD